MNEYVITAAVIVLILGIGFYLLVNFGIAEVVYFGLGAVIFSIVGSLVYTWWKTTADKTTERLKIEILTKLKGDYLDTKKFVSEAEELIDMRPIFQELDSIRNNLIKLGLLDARFEQIGRGVTKYTLTFIEQESRKTEQRLRALETLAAGSYRPKLDEAIRDMRSKLDRLKNAGYGIEEKIREFGMAAAQSTKTLVEMTEKKRKASEIFISTINACVYEADRLLPIAKKHGDTTEVERILSIKTTEIDQTIAALIDARNKMASILNTHFTSYKNALLASVESTFNQIKASSIDVKYKDAVKELRDELYLINDPGRIGEVMELEIKFKNRIINILSELGSELSRMEAEIVKHNPDRNIWDVDKETLELIKIKSTELDAFSKEVGEALRRLLTQFEKDIMFKKIVENFEKMEPIIARKLEEKGKLLHSDLNVKYADKFLLFYSLKHPDVEFAAEPPRLISKSLITSELREKLKRR